MLYPHNNSHPLRNIHLENQSPPPPQVYTHLPYTYTTILICVRIISINREGILAESLVTLTFLLLTELFCLNEGESLVIVDKKRFFKIQKNV